MKTDEDEKLLDQVRAIIESSDDRRATAERIAEAIRVTRDYRWVGIYDVGEKEIAVIAWSGQGAPAFPRFPVTSGLSADAVATKTTVVAGDVENDPRYLTAFGSTRSEMIVPVIEQGEGKVVGTIDVESERKDAFSDADRIFVERCARAIEQLWD